VGPYGEPDGQLHLGVEAAHAYSLERLHLELAGQSQRQRCTHCNPAACQIRVTDPLQMLVGVLRSDAPRSKKRRREVVTPGALCSR